jgi:hypothetical protein
MNRVTRRTAITVFGAGGLLALGYFLGRSFGPTAPTAPTAPNAPTLTDRAGGMRGGMMGSATREDMNAYMDMFNRHREISRTVEEIPGGVRTITEARSPDLAAQLQAHVSSMYAHLEERAEVTCMSPTLPILFRHTSDYRRQLTLTPHGVTVVETASDPDVARVIRAHAHEISGFVRDGMAGMMNQMMGR